LTVFDEGVYVDEDKREASAPWQMREAAVSIAATVRWAGESRRHGCDGFGIELEAPTDLLVKALRGRGQR
jgi:hypothetical protein